MVEEVLTTIIVGIIAVTLTVGMIVGLTSDNPDTKKATWDLIETVLDD